MNQRIRRKKSVLDTIREKEDRIRKEANYMIETKGTIRSTAKQFKVSRSTVHNDLHNLLKSLDTTLYNQVREISRINDEQKHFRGGEETKRRFQNRKK